MTHACRGGTQCVVSQHVAGVGNDKTNSSKRRFIHTTNSKHKRPIAPNLLARTERWDAIDRRPARG